MANLQSPASDDPAIAFDDLRREVSLLRRAIEGLTAERQNAPDYTPTLASLARRLGDIEQDMIALAKSPALRLTPQALGSEILMASERVRTDDRDTISQANTALRAAVSKIDAIVERARTAEQQWKYLGWTAASGVSFGSAAALLLVYLAS